MARNQTVSVAGLIISFVLLIDSAFARPASSSRSQHFQFFNVSASMEQARQVFSSSIAQENEPKPSSLSAGNSSANILSLTLHPRSTLDHPHYNKNFTALVLARLSRDAARVHAIHSKHSSALSGASAPDQIQAPLKSGIPEGSGEYFAIIGVGQPAQQSSMIIDTGSDVTWLQCQPCFGCYRQTLPIYNPSASSTYKILPCNAQQCRSLSPPGCSLFNTCTYQVSYGDGSYTIGDLANETLSFGSSGSVTNVAIGCGHINQGLFIGAAGLLGLGGGPPSFPSQINAASFSYCMVNGYSSSSSTLEFNGPPTSDSGAVFAKLIVNPFITTYKYIDLTGLSVNGQALPIPSSLFALNSNGRGGVIIDSGTSITRLPTQAYNALRDAFKSQFGRPTAGSYSLFDTCYVLSSGVQVPTVAFIFSGGQSLPLPANNVLFQVDNAGKFCLAFAPTNSAPGIIGNVQQQGLRILYNLAAATISFIQNKC